MQQKVFVVLFLTPFLVAPIGVSATEINYASVKTIAGDRLHIEYRGPAGTFNFMCRTNGECVSHGTTTPALTPSLAGSLNYYRNPQGTLGLRQFSLGALSYYILFDLTKNSPKNLGIIPISSPVSHIQFTDDGDHLVVVYPGGTAQRYTIASASWGPRVALSQNDLPFRRVSPRGTYLSAYNYGTRSHRIWNLTNGTHFTIPSNAPSYVEFSEDESKAAYADFIDGFKTLFTFPVSKLPTLESTRLTAPPALVEDYLFVGSKLFFIANQTHPLTWSLFAYENEKTTLIEEHVSYGDFMKRVPGGTLAYLKTEGKNTNVALFDTRTDTTRTLAPMPASPASNAITREAKRVADRHGVLLSPKNRRGDTLYIWLHGGPQRQTSVGYHPYLAYAVYDELLENIAESGAYVYKLDYTGSWGYGRAFQESLHKQIGIADIADVRRVIAALQRELGVQRVYLIGNSYGGYLALKGIAELPNVVAGAVSINGVSNWYSLATRIPSTPFATLFEGTPNQTNLQAYFASEVFTGLVNSVKEQPILVVYGERDSTVPVWQSTEYIEFAKANKKNIHTLALPEEDHVLRSRDALVKLCTAVKRAFNQRRLVCEV